MFNKSEIFKRAWRIKREVNIKFSDCLKKAWALEKNTINMKGTEKQKKYASDILETVKNCVKEIESIEEVKSNVQFEMVKEFNKNIISNIENAYAGEIIDSFKDVKNYEDLYTKIKIIAVHGGNYGKKDWRYKF